MENPAQFLNFKSSEQVCCITSKRVTRRIHEFELCHHACPVHGWQISEGARVNTIAHCRLIADSVALPFSSRNGTQNSALEMSAVFCRNSRLYNKSKEFVRIVATELHSAPGWALVQHNWKLFSKWEANLNVTRFLISNITRKWDI